MHLDVRFVCVGHAGVLPCASAEAKRQAWGANCKAMPLSYNGQRSMKRPLHFRRARRGSPSEDHRYKGGVTWAKHDGEELMWI